MRYEPETGHLFWINHPHQPHKNGKRADIQGSQGYRIVCLSYKQHLAHRLAWLLTNGEWPEFIDHKNGQRDDNRLENLRKASKVINSQNQRRARADNQSGFLGVSKVKAGYIAAIVPNKETGVVHLGLYKTPEEAHQRYLAEKRKVHEGGTL